MILKCSVAPLVANREKASVGLCFAVEEKVSAVERASSVLNVRSFWDEDGGRTTKKSRDRMAANDTKAAPMIARNRRCVPGCPGRLPVTAGCPPFPDGVSGWGFPAVVALVSG